MGDADTNEGADTDDTDDTAGRQPRRPFTRVQKQLFAFFAALAVWFVATVLLVLVGTAGGGAAAQYIFGALVVGLIPVMLVMLFVLLRHALADERHDAPPPEAVVTRDDVRATIARGFPGHDAATILTALDAATADVPLFDRAAVQRAIVVLSEGDVSRVHYFTEAARQDYRDLLVWANDMTASRADTR